MPVEEDAAAHCWTPEAIRRQLLSPRAEAMHQNQIASIPPQPERVQRAGLDQPRSPLHNAMREDSPFFPTQPVWEGDGTHRIPFVTYTSDEIYRKELERFYGEKGEIAWGSQIRSYVLQPYTMVKDHRTDHETSNTGAVLDGTLQPFIEAYLKQQAEARAAAQPGGTA
jgi:hypothetical protein